MANGIIKQINLGSASSPELYDIDALHLLDKNGSAHSYEDIAALIAKGLEIVIDTKHGSKDEPATAASASTLGKLYLVQLSGQTTSGNYTEFITLRSGTEGAYTYSWEKIGTTAADLTDYAKKAVAGKAGTYTSGGPSSNVTSSADAYAADVTISGIKYEKSATATGSKGSDTTTATTSELAAQSVTFNTKTFSGTAATLTHAAHNHTLTAKGSISVGTGTANYTPSGSISGTQSISAHSHAVNASTETVSISTSAASKKGVKVTTAAASTGSVGISGGTASGTSKFNTDAIKDFSLSASTVSTDGPAYIESISGSAPSLGGQKSVPTNAIKSVTLSESTTSTDGPAYISSVTLPTMTAISFTKNTLQSLTSKNYGFSASTSNVMTAPTVSNGVLSWTTVNAASQDALSAGSQASLTGGVFTAGSKTTKYMKVTGNAADTANVTISGGSYSGATKYLAHSNTAASKSDAVTGVTAAALTGTTTFVTSAIKSASLAEDNSSSPTFAFNTDAIKSASSSQVFVKSATLSTDGAATVNFANATFGGTGVELKFTGTSATSSDVTLDPHEYTPEGALTLTGSVAKHSHTYISLPAHTHGITLSSTSVTGTATAAISAHTHSLSNHTHNVTVPNCA